MYKEFLLASCLLFICFPSASQAVPLSFQAVLSGANEVDAAGNPVPSEPDATGLALVTIDGDQVSWNISVSDFEEPLIGAHIHLENPDQETGPIVIDFMSMLSGNLTDPDAFGITPETFGEYYVNLHTPTYPAGAIRGQLQLLMGVPEPSSMLLMLGGLAWLGRKVAWRV